MIDEKNLILREPKIEDKNAYLDFLTDWEDPSDITPYAAGLYGETYEEFISHLPLREKGLYQSDKLVPDNLYILVDQSGYIYGALNLRHTLNDYLFKYGGHIGYGIRLSKRKLGYGKLILKLGLQVAKSKGFKDILITCDQDNIASKKVILSAGGIFEDKIYKHDDYILRYWIHLDELSKLKRHVIVINGHLAAYKSTIAKRLSNDLGVVALIKDEFKEVMAEQIEEYTLVESLRISRTTFDLFLYLLTTHMKVLNDIIIKSNFRPNEFKRLESLCEEMHVEMIHIFLTGNIDHLYDRYLKRDRDRHYAHKSYGLLSLESFKKAYQDHDFNNYSDSYIFSTDEFNDKKYEQLLNYIKMKIMKEGN